MKDLTPTLQAFIFFWLNTLSLVIATCPPGKYGTNCSFACKPGCESGLCDHVTGNCSNCNQGRHGDQCKRDLYEPNYWPVAVGLVVAFLTLAFVFWRCHRSIVQHRKSVFRPAPTSSGLEDKKSSANRLSSPEPERRPTLCHTEKGDELAASNTSSGSAV